MRNVRNVRKKNYYSTSTFLTTRYPFQILEKEPQYPGRWSSEVRSLLKDILLSKDPRKRSVDSAKQSQWWNTVNWKMLFMKQMHNPVACNPMDMMSVGAFDDDYDEMQDDDGEECF